MIDFHVDLIRKTNEHFARLSKSADRQSADVKSAYETVKSELLNRINRLQSDIGTANAELDQANDILSHNLNLAEKQREIIRRAREKIDSLRSSRTKHEAKLSKLENMLSLVRALPSGKNTESTISSLQSRMTDVRCDIAEIDRDIEEENKKIEAAERKLAQIERANACLERVMSNIQKAIVSMKNAMDGLKKINSNTTERKNDFEAKCAERKRTMQSVYQRTEKALDSAERALGCFNNAGCGVSRQLTVDSPAVIFELSSRIDYAASDISSLAFELSSDADRFGKFMQDNISIEAREEASIARRVCEEKNSQWSSIALSLKNAAYQLQFYLECKL